uniref:Uncharacterized protein n=1 Tax=Ascaris lumbricoides TaxID=6252 RepID=A0A9J2PMU4_ASCLU
MSHCKKSVTQHMVAAPNFDTYSHMTKPYRHSMSYMSWDSWELSTPDILLRRSWDVKESFWQCFEPFVQLADEYVTFCDKVFSGLVRFVLRIMDTITTARSPIEIISNAFAALPSLIFSFITSVLYALFYLLTLPFRILFYILFYHPFASFIVFLLVVSVAFAVMVFLRRLSVTRLCRALWQTLAPYAYVFLRALVLLLFPQLNVIFNTLQLLFAPLIDFFSLILSLPARLTRRRSVRPASHRRGPVSPPEDSGDESTHGERLLCCRVGALTLVAANLCFGFGDETGGFLGLGSVFPTWELQTLVRLNTLGPENIDDCGH